MPPLSDRRHEEMRSVPMSAVVERKGEGHQEVKDRGGGRQSSSSSLASGWSGNNNSFPNLLLLTFFSEGFPSQFGLLFVFCLCLFGGEAPLPPHPHSPP